MHATPHVFISYCRSDGTKFATQLREILQKERPEIILWQDVISERGGRDWWLQITEALDHVACMVLVLTPDAMNSVTVRKEWRYARQKGVCVFPIQGSNKLNFNVLPRWIRDLQIDDLGYDERSDQFLPDGRWRKFLNQLESPCETPRVPFMAEDLPENFVRRPYEFERLVELLRDCDREEPIAVTAALVGAGGFGKSTLAKALCHDERIQEAFDDGILWATLGKSPADLTSKVVDLIEVLSGDRPGFKELEPASFCLSELLADRDILMVVDDVWNAVHLRPLLNGGNRCARLITTRNRQTLPAATVSVDVGAMQQGEALELLAARTNPQPQDVDRLRGLAEKLEQWPMLLRLVNAVLRTRLHQQQSLPTALDYAQEALARRGLIAFDAKDPKARDEAVAETMGVSLELLAQDQRARFAELAIFPENTDIPLSAIAQLWRAICGFDEFDTEELCSRLQELSLLLGFDLNTRNIRLHGIMRKFLEGRLEDAASTHAKLVDAWGDLHQLQHSYGWRFLAYHLVLCNRQERLRQLLLDYRWIRAKLHSTDITSLISDYNNLVTQDLECATVQASLRLSAHLLAKKDMQPQLAGQLLGRLLNSNSPVVQSLLSQAAQNTLWLRPLTATLTPPGGPLLFTLEGHSDLVNAVAITPDSAHAVSASDDCTLKVWELKTGQLLHSLEGHSNSVNAVAISPDGRYAISASSDRTLKVWELETSQILHSLEGQDNRVNAVAISPDGNYAISASDNYILRVWELNTGQLLQPPEGHTNRVNAVIVSPDGRHAISAASDRTLKVWDMETGQVLHSFIRRGLHLGQRCRHHPGWKVRDLRLL